MPTRKKEVPRLGAGSLQSLCGKVLVEPLEPPEVSPGGVHLVREKDWRSRPTRGRVVSAGPDVDLKPGDEVILAEYGREEIDLGGGLTLLSYDQDKVLARIEP
jgi:co-chaperonin GroES (HSP10)